MGYKDGGLLSSIVDSIHMRLNQYFKIWTEMRQIGTTLVRISFGFSILVSFGAGRLINLRERGNNSIACL